MSSDGPVIAIGVHVLDTLVRPVDGAAPARAHWLASRELPRPALGAAGDRLGEAERPFGHLVEVEVRLDRLELQ